MREIKFRAWFKDHRYMLNDIKLGEDNFQECLPDGEVYILNLKYATDIMQFTGLKDKNGKEIYEGDIISVNAEWKGRKHIGQIIYNQYRFECEGFYFPHFDDPSNVWEEKEKNIEIIGNIYETPELLK